MSNALSPSHEKVHDRGTIQLSFDSSYDDTMICDVRVDAIQAQS